MRLLLALLFCSLAIGPAVAQTAETSPGASDIGRYQMTPAAGGFLRLDTRTGAVSLCTIAGAAAECRAAADDRAALMSEVERLAKRNAELEAGGPRTARPGIALPSKEDVGKAMDYAEEFMRRMMRVMRNETKDRT